MSLDMNSPDFAKRLIAIIDDRAEKKTKEVMAKAKTWAIGTVQTTRSGNTISVKIGNSTTAVDVKNPRSFSLTAGQLVMVIYPNYKLDNMAYIDRVF